MSGDRDNGAKLLRAGSKSEKQSCLDGIEVQEDPSGRASRLRERVLERQALFKLFLIVLLNTFILFLACGFVVRSVLDFHRHYQPAHVTEARPHIARYAAPQEATANITSSPTSFSSTTSTALSTTTPDQVFQVFPPILGANGLVGSNGLVPNTTLTKNTNGNICQVTMMVHSFSSSFGQPFIGDYTPPSCMGDANTVTMNFSVTSQGVQFDRLAIMYFGDTEVFRTSTAEPKRKGIAWEYVKDMSHYISFWKSSQVLIFDLPNQVTTNLTGSYNTTLIATFLNAKLSVNAADMVIPISARMGVNASMPSVFSVPEANASNSIAFPRNANRAVFSVSSCGQGDEEFWWSNVLQSDTSTFLAEGGPLPGFSPFREVQVYIDGMLAGVQWPFAVIFTGGVVPAFWSPMVGIDAFDLQEYQIDISPWLPMLCDGYQHTFTMKVAGLQDDGGSNASLVEAVGSSWLLTGKIFIWLDAEGSITTGTTPTISTPEPTIVVSQTLNQNSTGANETISYTISVKRTISIISTVTTAQRTTQQVQWTQTLTHTDDASVGSFGNSQVNNIATTGKDESFGLYPYSHEYSFPVFANSTAAPLSNGSTIFLAEISRTKMQKVSGSTIYPSGLQPFALLPQTEMLVLTLAGTSMINSQNGTATLLLTPGNVNKTLSFGSTQQMMRFGGVSADGALGMEPDTELFYRSVKVVNGTVKDDVQRLVGSGVVGFSVANGGSTTGNVWSEAMVGRMPEALMGAQR